MKRNPEYNLKMLAEVDHSNKNTQLDFDAMYGPDFSDDSKRVDLAFRSNHNSPHDIDFNSRVRFPALVSTVLTSSASPRI